MRKPEEHKNMTKKTLISTLNIALACVLVVIGAMMASCVIGFIFGVMQWCFRLGIRTYNWLF